MQKPIIFSLIESPEHPRFSDLYKDMGYDEMQFSSSRKLISALKKYKPDVIVAQFLYAYASNYASNHISNLDTLLITLQKYGDYKPKFIFLTYKEEHKHLSQLISHYEGFSKINHSLVLPVAKEQMKELL